MTNAELIAEIDRLTRLIENALSNTAAKEPSETRIVSGPYRRDRYGEDDELLGDELDQAFNEGYDRGAWEIGQIIAPGLVTKETKP